MPIKFRCQHCKQFLGISRAKAGLVTDCPTCGRTIRVPNLDGAVDPLPQPELNLKDAELAEALGALASLHSAPQRHQSVTRDTAGETAESLKPTHAPPVIAEPMSPATPLQLHSADAALNEDQSVLIRSARQTVDPLSELADLAERSPLKDQRAQRFERPRPLRTGFGPGVLLLVSIVCLGCGMLIGAGLFRRSTAERDDAPAGVVNAAVPASPAPHVPKKAQAKPAPVAGGTIGGRITYVAQNGESRSDRGARILLLPERRSGSVKLPIDAFLAGADDADAAIAAAALKASGGGFAIADEQGAYSLSLPNGGRYRAVFISRYQPRNDLAPMANDLHEALAPYFDRPDRLIGNMRCESEIVEVEPGGELLKRDCQFEQ